MFKETIDRSLNAIAKNRALGFVVVMGFAFACVLAIHFLRPVVFEEFEHRTWDWRLKVVADPGRADKNIKLIIVDQSTLEFFEREYSITWPFPRDIYRYVVDYLTRAGAKGLAFDLLFTESSAQAVEADTILADASAGKLPVVHAVTMETVEKFLAPEKFGQFAKRQQDADQRRNFSERYLDSGMAQTFVSATLPIPELIEKSRGFGSVSAISDSDGVFRHYSVGGRLRKTAVLSLPFELYDIVSGDSQPYPMTEFLDDQSRLTVRLHGPSGTYPSYSLKAIAQSEQQLSEGLKPSIDPSEFKDAWVFLGVWAPGLLDLRPTPLEERGRGVEYVAAVLDNIIHRDFVITFSRNTALLITAVLITLALITVFFVQSALLQIIILISLIGTFIGSAFFLASQAIWVPVFIPFIATLCSVLAGLGLQFQVEGRQHRFVRGAFQYYVSKGVIDQIMSDPSRLTLGGEKRELTIFFSDIKGFTSISEQLDPPKLVSLLNKYLTELTDIILQSGGTLDKYVGDAIVAFWNAPVSIEDHALRGVTAAIDCQKRLDEMRAHLKEEFGVEVHTRIGIHTGAVSVGNFGSKTRFNYTMIGDSANLASRLEGVNKVFGTTILISGDTKKLLGDTVLMRRVADLRVVGKSEVVTVYQPYIADQHLFEEEHLKTYLKALELFEQGALDQAEQAFNSLENDAVAQQYVKRIKSERTAERSEWSAVWNMTDK